jgi:hypothetical protein
LAESAGVEAGRAGAPVVARSDLEGHERGGELFLAAAESLDLPAVFLGVEAAGLRGAGGLALLAGLGEGHRGDEELSELVEAVLAVGLLGAASVAGEEELAALVDEAVAR